MWLFVSELNLFNYYLLSCWLFNMDTSKPKVLIVDDNSVCLKLAMSFAQESCQCVGVDNGEKALTAFVDTFRNNETKYNVILLDYEMPSMTGLEVLTEIRNAEKKRNVSKADRVKIIMTTSYNDRQVVNACKVMGCDHYLLKPITFKSLQARLKALNVI